MTAAHNLNMEKDQSTRLNGDSKSIVRIVVWLVACLALASFVAGVPGLWAAGEWALLPGVLPALVPVILDGGLVVFSLVTVVRRARRETAKFAWAAITTLTLASLAAQVVHVLVTSSPTWQAGIGAAVAALFPTVVFGATHSLLDLAVAPAPTRAGKGSVKRQPGSATKSASVAAAKVASNVVAKPYLVAGKTGKAERLVRVLELHRAGISQRQIAVQTGVSRPTVAVWLNGVQT